MGIPTAHVVLFRQLYMPEATILTMGRPRQTPLTTKSLLPSAKPHLPLTTFADRRLRQLEQCPRTL
jgi:hypothetical protein